ncbi:MAG: hypothetical protein AB8G95_18140 [Anaerolineae bacterium]
MSDAFPFFVMACFVLLVPVIAYIKHSGYTDRISKEVAAKGFKAVSIQRRWVDFDENTATYDVEYQDEYGNGYQTSCKIRSLFLFFEGSLYWTKPLIGRDGNQINREMTQQLLIDALRKENKQLKDKLKELESANDELKNSIPTHKTRRPLGRSR